MTETRCSLCLNDAAASGEVGLAEADNATIQSINVEGQEADSDTTEML